LIHETSLKKLNLDSEITIVISGRGTQQILSNLGATVYSYTNYELPNQILINGILQNYIEKYVYNLTNQINNITMKWNNQITNCNGMFQQLTNIISVDLSKFDSSKVVNFDSIFYNSYNIKSIILANLNTSSSEIMAGMFYNCRGLETLNLSSFDTSKVTTFWHMFNGCTSLKSLDLSSFITSNAIDMDDLFNSCSSLMFLNIINFNTPIIHYTSDMFSGVNENLVYCADPNKISKINSWLSKYKNNCSEICPKFKFIFDKKICINNCYNDKEYKYEYNNRCYKSCPYGTRISKINNNFCEYFNCDKYYNYNHTDCLESIPEGYYLNNSILKTIDKCNDKCQNCSLESLEKNLCLSCNIKNGYYPLLNNDSINNTFINCYNESIKGYILDDLEYKPCYNICENCIGNKDENNIKCRNCKLNCYNECDYYYYFDENNEYFCTGTNKCPEKYNKLISGKKKCIENCSNDKEYKYEFNGICYQQKINEFISTCNATEQ